MLPSEFVFDPVESTKVQASESQSRRTFCVRFDETGLGGSVAGLGSCKVSFDLKVTRAVHGGRVDTLQRVYANCGVGHLRFQGEGFWLVAVPRKRRTFVGDFQAIGTDLQNW